MHEAQPALQAVVAWTHSRTATSTRSTTTFGLTVEAQITAIENGQADWTFDAPPADRLDELGTKYATQVHVTPLTAIWYVPMNTNLAPFNNLKARQAVSYAIDRNAAGEDLRRPGARDRRLPGAAAGLPGPRGLLPVHQESGRASGRLPTWRRPRRSSRHRAPRDRRSPSSRPTTRSTRRWRVYLQSVLNSIGYKATVKPISANISFTYLQNTKNKVQINVQQWYQDYPAASDFLYILFGCESFHPGSDSSINMAGFCDKKINAQMHDGAEAGRDQRAAREQACGRRSTGW